MEEKQGKGFDFYRLLKLGLLDIKGIAQRDLFLSVGDYVTLLYRFKNEGQRALDALGEIACGNSDKTFIGKIESMKNLLEDLGCRKLILILSDIISALKKDNIDLAADCAKSIMEQFTTVHKKISATEITSDHQEILSLGDVTNTDEAIPFAAQTLAKYIDKLEREEKYRKLRVLAIDDSPPALKSISLALSKEYKVYGMSDPMNLEKFLQDVTPELFLLDYKMPQRSGFELIPIIRSFEEHKTTPIIILTAMGSVDHISAALSLGACDFIVKPFDGDNLSRKIAKHIKKKKLF